jgi:glycosyltransferase involved in cell wall biosynthesis
MAAANMLVHPSHAEGMPNVVLEAGAAGLPVVAARGGGVPELIGDNVRGLLVPARDAKALESAIGEVRQHPDAALARAELLRDHMREHYDTNHMARRLAGIYEQLVRTSA